MKTFIASLTLTLFLCSFQTEDDLQDKLIGFWVLREYKGQEAFYHRSRNFLADSPGVRFMKEGKLIVRLNNTLHTLPGKYYDNYQDYDGSWKRIDSTFILKYNSQNGEVKEAWELSHVDSNTLIIRSYGSLGGVRPFHNIE
jgi:hypothetical protein